MNWFCDLSGLNCLDLQRAVSDIQLQLNVTLAFLGLLIAFVIIFGIVSKWLTSRKQATTPSLSKLDRMGWRNQPEPALQKSHWWSDYWQGISTEFFGAVVTTVLLGLGVLIFEQYQDIQNRKAELILQMGSDERVWAIEAVRQLDVEGWLSDGALNNAILWNADLTNADLRLADLTNANLYGVNFTNARSNNANFMNAYLDAANFTNADLDDANFTNADLLFANFTNAYLDAANFMNANLRLADFNETIILPDGTNWTPDTDMARFTDPTHPNFWNPCVEVSPAPWYCE
ncbi:MAG: pentapeptide repeat-containing protein [Chloroflexota bacterium]